MGGYRYSDRIARQSSDTVNCSPKASASPKTGKVLAGFRAIKREQGGAIPVGGNWPPLA